jgi:hypothetical protein
LRQRYLVGLDRIDSVMSLPVPARACSAYETCRSWLARDHRLHRPIRRPSRRRHTDPIRLVPNTEHETEYCRRWGTTVLHAAALRRKDLRLSHEQRLRCEGAILQSGQAIVRWMRLPIFYAARKEAMPLANPVTLPNGLCVLPIQGIWANLFTVVISSHGGRRPVCSSTPIIGNPSIEP